MCGVLLMIFVFYVFCFRGFVEYFDVGKLSKFEHLRELRINLDDESVSYSSFSFSGGLNALGDLKHLRILVSSERGSCVLIFYLR